MERLIEQINTALEELLATVEGNEQKIKEVVTIFVQQTPIILGQIEDCINGKRYVDAAKLVHKIKTRYGYLGLESVVANFTLLEKKLSQPETGDLVDSITNIKKTNEEVMKGLKSTNFYDKKMSQPNATLQFTGRCILIAEDDNVNAMVFDLFIRETGASTLLAADGAQALRMAIEHSPDLILMDVHMPFFSGIEAIKELRNRGIMCPIISLSASTRLNEKQNSIEAGANDFLVKPANRESINKVLLKYLS